MIKLTLVNDSAAYVNPDRIEWVLPSPAVAPKGSDIATSAGLTYSVKESPEQVLALIREAGTVISIKESPAFQPFGTSIIPGTGI